MVLKSHSSGGVEDGDESSVDDLAVAQAAASGSDRHVRNDGASSSSSEESPQSSSADGSSNTSGEGSASEGSYESTDSESDALSRDMEVRLVLSVRGAGDHISVTINPVNRSSEVIKQNEKPCSDVSDSSSDSPDSSGSMTESAIEVHGLEGIKDLSDLLKFKSAHAEEAGLAKEQTSHGLPPAEKLSVEISETDEIKPIGVVENVVDGVYVTKALDNEGPVLNAGSALCLEDRTPLGPLDDVIGKIGLQHYLFRYTEGPEPPSQLTHGTKIFYVVKYAKTVDESDLQEKGYDAAEVIGPNGIEEDGQASDGEGEQIAQVKRKNEEPVEVIKQGQGRGMGGVARGQRSRRGADRGRSGAPRGRQQNGGGRHYQGRESSGGGRAGGSTSSLSSMGHRPSSVNGSLDPTSGRSNTDAGRNRNNGQSHQHRAPPQAVYSGFMPMRQPAPLPVSPYMPAMLPSMMYGLPPHGQAPQAYMQHGNLVPCMPGPAMQPMYGMPPPAPGYVAYPQAWGNPSGMPFGVQPVWGPPGPNGVQAAPGPYPHAQPGQPQGHQSYSEWQNQGYQ